MGRLRSIGTAFVLVTAACASLPSDYPPPQPSVALEPDAATDLGRLGADFVRRHGVGVSGYAAIDLNSEGLRWRLALVDSAERSLDLLYYLWYDDLGGLTLLEHVIQAAERGVRVRSWSTTPSSSMGNRASQISVRTRTSRSAFSTRGRAQASPGDSRPLPISNASITACTTSS